VKDDEIVSFNFPTRLDKGVKVSSTFYRNKVDSTWHLAGKWKTNQTKTFYSVSGKVDLSEEKDLTASKLFPHLEELNLANEMVFYKNRKQQDVVMKTVETEAKMFSSIRDEQQRSIPNAVPSSNLSNNVEVNAIKVSTTSAILTNAEVTRSTALDIPVKTQAEPITAQVKSIPAREKTNIRAEEQKIDQTNPEIKPSTETVKVNTTAVTPVNIIRTNPELTKSTSADIPVKTQAEPITAQVKSTPAREKTNIQTEKQQTERTIAQKPNAKPTTSSVSTTKVIQINPEVKKPEAEPIIAKNTLPEKTLEQITAPAKTIGGRNSEFAQTVNFKSDSLELSLYDNGEIDGDTVSVFMNGVPLLSKQGLKASAIKKTIYLTPGSNDEFTLVLFAENLGKYPPNTGLLVVHDGEDVYNVRFSADYQKNAGVVFRRKK
jgi:hypothetical protein